MKYSAVFRYFPLGIVLLAATQPASAEDYAERWTRLANEHLAMVKSGPGRDYERGPFIEAHQPLWRDVAKRCKADVEKSNLKKFSAIAVIDAQGRVTEFLTLPQHPALDCLVQAMVGQQYPPPPFAPYYELINLKL